MDDVYVYRPFKSSQPPVLATTVEPSELSNLDCCPVCAALWDETIDKEAHISECLHDEILPDLSDGADSIGSLQEPRPLHDELGYGDDALELQPSSWTTTSVHHIWNSNSTKGNGNSKPVGIPYLRTHLFRLLSTSCNDGAIRFAILCTPNVLHIRSTSSLTRLDVGDSTWGCGYRNIQMLLSAVRHVKDYQFILSSQPDLNPPPSPGQSYYPHTPPKNYVNDEVVDIPSIQTCQTIIEKAWKIGFDPEGARQFSQRLIGKSKWIGTTEAYVAFTSLGIRARIIDFPRPTGPKGTHIGLTSWIREYFHGRKFAGNENHNVFQEIMSSKGNAIKLTDKLPLYLQHAGHSQTVVGFEMDAEGRENLLIYDPAKTVPASLKSASCQMIQPQNEISIKLKKKNSSTSQLINPLQDQSGVKLILNHSSESPQPPKKKFKKGFALEISTPYDLQRHDQLLAPFRVCINTLSKHEQYQILCVDEGPALSKEETMNRRIITSVRVE
ncbi:peptidase family C78-domain-containing protein [Melampsora americana]|nr:peptidase family C78-domain-containing protein [Melampsora americana]